MRIAIRRSFGDLAVAADVIVATADEIDGRYRVGQLAWSTGRSGRGWSSMTAAMPPEAAIWWLRMALGDLAAARALLDVAEVAPRQPAYLAEQAAEKALKATIALKGLEPPWRTT